MSITNALLNGASLLLTDIAFDIGSQTSEQSSAGITFLERPAVIVLKGTGQACKPMFALCAGGDKVLNSVTFSGTVQKNQEDAIDFDVSDASISAFEYGRTTDGIGQATLRLLVRKMDLTIGDTEIPFEFDPPRA